MATITAANSVYTLAIDGLYPIPQQLQGYATDAAFDTDASDPAEVRIGVDGRVSAGFTPYLTMQTISLQADSASSQMFEDWIAAQKVVREVYLANGRITLPSIRRAYVLTQGVLTKFPAIPGVKKLLEPRNFVITWGDVSAEPF